MSRHTYCPQGHRFDWLEAEWPDPEAFPLRCKVCRSVVARTLEEFRVLVTRDSATDPEIELPPDPAATVTQSGPPIPPDYEVVAAVGRGGVGSIFRAVQRKFGRVVALKMVPPTPHEDRSHRARLLERGRAAALLDHPHLVRTYDFGEYNGWLYEAQEFMDGGDLSQLLQLRRGLSPHQAALLLAPIARAVHYLHEHGYIHCNLKPRKVLLTAAGTPKLADLDLAKRRDEDQPEGSLVGTPSYMAPEQARGDNAGIGPATDVYGLGAILYETLTGRPPFHGGTLMETLQQTMTAEPTPLRQLLPGVPRELEQICSRTLQKDPRRRYATARELAEQLERFAGGQEGPATGTPAPSAVPRSLPSVAAPPPTAPPTPPPRRAAPPAAMPPMPESTAYDLSEPEAEEEARVGRADTGRSPRRADSTSGDALPGPFRPLPRRKLGLWARLRAWLGGWLGGGRQACDQVDATVFAPPIVANGQEFMVQVFAHLPAQSGQARELAQEFDPQAERRGFTSLELEVANGERLTFHLTMPGLRVDRPRAGLLWRRRPDAVQFGVLVPPDHPAGTVLGTVTVSLETVPVGHIKFKLTVTRGTPPLHRSEPGPTGESAQRYRYAFISYASADRKEVLKRVQMLARLHIRFFQDILDLDPGVRWERELYRQIDQSDLFLLFWSSPARESKWVLEEIRYALRRKGDNELAPPEIMPIVLEGPPPPPPPDELAHLQFNDYLLYFMQDPGSQ
jgi:serine/threonine protein kinase